MLKPLLTVAFAATTLSFMAHADDAAHEPADKMDILAGAWSWEHKTVIPGSEMFGGIEQESNVDCVTEEMKPFTVQSLINELTASIPKELGQKCLVQDVVDNEEGFDFNLVCSGPYTGSAKGKATFYSPEKIAIQADGQLTLLGGASSGPFSMNAKAERVGACPAKKS